MQIPFCGTTYPARSKALAANRSINWYPEMNGPDAKYVVSMIGTPGSRLWKTIGSGVIRGARVFAGWMYVVSGQEVWRTDGVLMEHVGDVLVDGDVAMRDNGVATSTGVGGNQLAILDAGGNLFIYNVVTGLFAQALSGWPVEGACSLEYLDGYFVVAVQGGMIFRVSDKYDGMTWNGLAEGAVNAFSDNLLMVLSNHQQLWMVKESNYEIWADVGIATISGCPFARVPNTVGDYGVVGSRAGVAANNTIYWLATARSGANANLLGVVEVQGYVPTLVSPPAINYQLSRIPVSDVIAWAYAEEGHTFIIFTFPSGDWTIVYDAATKMWHERAATEVGSVGLKRHRASCYVSFGGKHYIGDYRGPRVYEMGSDYYDDDGDPLVSQRITQHISDTQDLEWLSVDKLHVDMEVGEGMDPTSILSSLVSEPRAGLAWSVDGGYSWSSDHWKSIGAIGERMARVVWRQLGMGADRVFRLTISDPVRRIILGANAEVSK